MEKYAEGDLAIDVAQEGALVRLHWRGKSNARDPGATLHPFLDGVASTAKASGAVVEMRLNDLEYFNSSTLAALIRAIRRFKEQGTKIVITYQESTGWQRRSCDALRVLESDGAVEIRGD
jgi:hypothetical protein